MTIKDGSPLPLREALKPKAFVAEGKTKVIWETENPEFVLIESKDDLTAGDGTRRVTLPGKGKLATTTTENVFTLLEREGIYTHFVDRYSENIFVARKALMIPVESVARRKATGSYLKRHPEVTKGTLFPAIEHEFFYKDDLQHDPRMVLVDGLWHFYDASAPESSKPPLFSREFDSVGITRDEVTKMQVMTREVFAILEEAWKKLGIELIDLKIEFGRDIKGNLMVADVIDNDSWRLWPNGDETRDLSKQVFRNNPNPTEEDLEGILENYRQVVRHTNHFYYDHYPQQFVIRNYE